MVRVVCEHDLGRCVATLELTPRQSQTIAAAITTVSALVILVAVGLLGWLTAVFLRAFSGVFLPLAVGAVSALVFRPYSDWLRTTARLPMPVAVAAVFLSALVPLGIFVTFFGRLGIQQLVGLASQAPEWWGQARVLAEEQLPRVTEMLESSGLDERLQQMATARQAAIIEWLQTVGVQAATAGFGLARGATALFSWMITPVYFAYFLTASRLKLDTEHVLPFLKPNTRDDVTYLLHEFVDLIVAFFRGQMIIALLQGLMLAAGFSMVGLSYGFVIGLVLGFLNVIPYLGHIIGLAVAIPLALFQADGGPVTCGLVLIVFVVVQQIEGWWLMPKIMGDRTGPHFMAITVAVFFWGAALGGILGLILAIPLTAFLASLWRLARDKYIPEIL
ncbi:MAG: AI-2E family transporter [Acidobacteriota bacterium]|nr:AI-2E family transporter [Acidobacteriota bacterium]